MDEEALAEDWGTLLSYLPADLEVSARQHGFVRRSTGRQDARTWLRLILMHVAGGLSLAQTAARAKARGWAQTSPVALHKRLRTAGPWLQALTKHLLAAQRRQLKALPIQGATLRIIDATDIQEPGSTGTDWRLHYSLRLPDLACDHFELTDSHTAEHLARFAYSPGEVVLADRGYCNRSGVAQVLDAQADVVVRLIPSNFPLLDETGGKFDVLAHCQELRAGRRKEWRVWFEWQGWQYPLRLCVMRKPAAAAQQARRKACAKATRMGYEIKESTLENASLMMVLTSLEPEPWSSAQVLDLYRCRWQIELAFKRLKSLLQAGHVPKSSDPTARAWLQAKVLISLLVEILLCDSHSFSPRSRRLG